jgi:hypothetical protein
VLGWLGCASPQPPPSLPRVYATTPSERLPIDGLWQLERKAPEAAKPTREDELWKTSPGPLIVQLERGRMYLQSGFGPKERHGTLVLADVHQSAANSYRCRRPVRSDDSIVWLPCKLSLGEDGSLGVATRGVEQRLHFKRVALADETWFAAQAEAWHIVSVREAHKPAPELPVIAPAVVVPTLPPSAEPTRPKVDVPSGPTRSGRYRALVVGSAEYTYLPGVATAEGDAAAVSRLLERRYGFEVTHLKNPTLPALLGALDRYRRDLSKNDNFLLYWAGHGAVSDEVGRCYWIPVDATGDDPTEGLANDDLAETLREMKAKHILVVADSCFTASQRREAGLPSGDPDAQEKLSKLRSRVVLTSGGLEPIQDGRGGGHSVFTGALLDALSGNGDVLDGTTLFGLIQERVKGASQTPEYADIRGAGHGGGDFLFVPSD